MAITLWNLFEATLLCLNAVCVLNEERFLSKLERGSCTLHGLLYEYVGFGLKNPNHLEGFGESSQGPSAKAQVLHLIRSIRTVVKYPLIAINVLIIAIKLILG